MSLIPSSIQGAPGDTYFPLEYEGILRNPTILPGLGNYQSDSGTLWISNGGVTDPVGHAMEVAHYVPRKLGGGLTPGLYQSFMYGPDIGGNNIGYLFYGQGLGNNNTVMGFNRARPLDAGRMGKITGTGAPQAVACGSIVAGSLVNLAFVAGTPAAADVAVTITPNTSFTLTLPAGAVYNYEVIG